MTLRKNSNKLKLNKPIDTLLGLKLNDGNYWLQLVILPVKDIISDRKEFGKPYCGARLDNHTIIVYPRANKNYEVEVTGAEVIVQ